MSPTQRTLVELREMGFQTQVVERWNQYARKRIDLFGIIDLIACQPGIGILGVQTTSGDNHASRRAKAIVEPKLLAWLASGGRFEIWSWAKRGGRGERKTWQLRREEITREDMDLEEA